ncbi:hypothetical protein DEJ51_21935 [Streptomyces venezuelae]|uniref:DUF3152 domain-containing protein n=1 Tax=Streptomyces venezuelae TaxID=54571 RepID=A0A5P2DUZ8_STRVZ|nr:DUF3152 domain-containing protein [Streptomyces venezuelae]QES56509.1 hypothetical protein DEJ51_21935 [Streptomyces venezuelae]
MGRHSRKGPAPAPAPAPVRPQPEPLPYEEPPAAYRPEPTVTHQGYVSQDRPYADARTGGHPQQYESGGAWGVGPDSVYGDWHGVRRPHEATAATPAPTALRDCDTPAFGTPAVGFPQVTLAPPAAFGTDPDPVTSTGAQRRVPGPRKPVDPVPPVSASASVGAPADADADVPAEDPPGSGRGRKARTFTGIAAVAVTTVLAVVVAGQMASDADGEKSGAQAAVGDSRADAGASRSDDRATPQGAMPAGPAAPAAVAPEAELTYEQKMAVQFPLDAKLAGPGTFDTVPGVAKAPGKGKLVRYRVDVEQGLGLDAQLFAEAIHRTLNDDRSWGHGGTKTFERVPGGNADFVITLASPGTTGVWCAKSDLDTVVGNVSCDSARTERVMINAFRWAQGSETYGPDQMFIYRQMLINHEVGHRLGHDHVNCRTPGALAPVMQQQTKSLNIDGIQCKPNPWVFPES